ncbi:MAG: TIGR02449 family protein [Xanthomonadales bacterium]|nr:TIGR02449 family protein [Xanthomonadales bacterium]
MALPSAIRQELDQLLAKVNDLVNQNAQLQSELASLRDQHSKLGQEKAGLLAKNEQARTRVEAMIARLRALETSGE